MDRTASVVIVGYGAAALRCAEALADLGRNDVVLVTEHRSWGTSRNTGSDKQTYYKLQLGGEETDSVRQMAGQLFQGGAVDGEHAMVEAALSAESFLHLVELGVPFPRNRWGEYIGYRTDHDAAKRATSAGPYTSRFMVEKLERSLDGKVAVYEYEQLVNIVTEANHVRGIVCYNSRTKSFDRFASAFVVLATGGPAHCFLPSVYPISQHGASGIAYEAGCSGRNLTEFQLGMASLKPRWNVSGTYMQAIPRFVSTRADGSDEKEFLLDEAKVTPSLIFLKGYQWPFDAQKAMEGSSLIDLLVKQEQLKGRRVFLDYLHNPTGFTMEGLSEEAYGYLADAKALQETPIERLRAMNEPAYRFYLEHGVDLEKEKLEIGLCVQHSNGGIAVDGKWMTDVEGLFAIGECACTHGIKRPGGSALNASQVGALRVARVIAKEPERTGSLWTDGHAEEKEILEHLSSTSNVKALAEEIGRAMADDAGAVRDPKKLQMLLERVEALLASGITLESTDEAGDYYALKDMLLTDREILASMIGYSRRGIGSRGSAIYTDPKGTLPSNLLDESFRFTAAKDEHPGETELVKDGQVSWRAVHPLPRGDDFFEVVWKDYREGRT